MKATSGKSLQKNMETEKHLKAGTQAMNFMAMMKIN